MIVENTNVLNHRSLRSFVRAHYVIWIEARNRETNAPEQLVVWDGADNISSNLPGIGVRDWFGAGRLLQMPDFTFENGLDVRSFEIALSQTDETIRDLIFGYDVRLARVWVFRSEWNRYNQISIRRIFKGVVDGAPITSPEFEGEEGGIALRIVSDAIALTQYGSHMKNHEFQKRRSNDDFRQYSAIQIADAPWGMKRKKEAKTQTIRNAAGGRTTGVPI